ncbi:hypothetical protein [Methylophilus aquaticus]|uniref:Uncharacterized protein n=1 Tax=Methylophilus aquaticus TaxID=1971610 RepID=A0ABT9JUF3_9PROT|nr:hypothetical protein [Methylophilus aquaticus]MDP8568192.1 hypothetical protein [Methylophilus aquaticus]
MQPAKAISPSITQSASQGWWLWGGLLVTLGLVYWVSQIPDDAPEADDIVMRRPASDSQATTESVKATGAEPSAAVPASPVTKTGFVWQRPAIAPKTRHALFAAHEWLPPPVKAAPPPPPVAPPVPFAYIGSMEEMPEGHTVILMQQKKLLMPRMGTQVTPQWRLDREDAQSVYFTYLPLNQPKLLSKTGKLVVSRTQTTDPYESNASEMANQ